MLCSVFISYFGCFFDSINQKLCLNISSRSSDASYEHTESVMVVEQFTAHFKMSIFKNGCDMQQRSPGVCLCKMLTTHNNQIPDI